MKSFKEIQVMDTRQNGRVREVVVNRCPGGPEAQERVILENFGECLVMSCQPAGRDNFKLIVRRV